MSCLLLYRHSGIQPKDLIANADPFFYLKSEIIAWAGLFYRPVVDLHRSDRLLEIGRASFEADGIHEAEFPRLDFDDRNADMVEKMGHFSDQYALAFLRMRSLCADGF